MAKEYHSKYKTWILDYLGEHKDSRLSASEIHTAMAKDGLNANLVTIYRNLDRLVDEKKLNRQKISGEEENFYQFLAPDLHCTSHLHLICSKCGRIIHLNCEFMKEISDHLLADHGFQIDCQDSALVGLCRDCRAKSAV